MADEVSVSGDYLLRARWSSEDELGRLVASFNLMLEKLDRSRRVEQDLAASAVLRRKGSCWRPSRFL